MCRLALSLLPNREGLLFPARRRMLQPIPEQGRWLAQVTRGYFAYHAVATNFSALRAFPSNRVANNDRKNWPPTASRTPIP